MTAEVAILNKGAVVLAADSAVTISRGSSQEKTFDTAEKLFELSTRNHVGIMVNGDLDFLEAPLAVLIKSFRDGCDGCESIHQITTLFLEFLSEFSRATPQDVLDNNIKSAVSWPLGEVQTRASKKFEERLQSNDFFEGIEGGVDALREHVRQTRKQHYAEQIAVLSTWLERFPDASFTGDGAISLRAGDRALLDAEVREVIPELEDEEREAAIELAIKTLKKAGFGSSITGVIIAGFGESELFPTLISLNIYGVVSGRLKYHVQEECDIDRAGTKARVVAFAQREMVDRFLFGIDAETERKISAFSRGGIAQIRESIFDRLDIDGDGLAGLQAAANEAEEAFLNGLSQEGFKAIRAEAQAEIEEMAEFMPKMEMARMAEALVNLTSIKRRVSRGMETVGGPIDVAVISRSEGLVWVKRKHYFPAELNARFFERKRVDAERVGGNGDEQDV